MIRQLADPALQVPDIDRCLTDPTYVPISFAIPEWGLPAIPTCGFFTRVSHHLPRTMLPCPQRLPTIWLTPAVIM